MQTFYVDLTTPLVLAAWWCVHENIGSDKNKLGVWKSLNLWIFLLVSLYESLMPHFGFVLDLREHSLQWIFNDFYIHHRTFLSNCQPLISSPSFCNLAQTLHGKVKEKWSRKFLIHKSNWSQARMKMWWGKAESFRCRKMEKGSRPKIKYLTTFPLISCLFWFLWFN